MSKKILIAVVALVILTGIVLILTGNKAEDEINNNSTQSIEQQEVATIEQNSEQQQEATTASSGLGYVDYSDQTLADSSNSTRVLFFHAPWCSVCNFYEGQIEEQGVPSDVTILKIDFDSEDELKEQYNVTFQSTFLLLDEDGNIKDSWPFARGLSDIQDLYSQI
jgi:hypothetical protein